MRTFRSIGTIVAVATVVVAVAAPAGAVRPAPCHGRYRVTACTPTAP